MEKLNRIDKKEDIAVTIPGTTARHLEVLSGRLGESFQATCKKAVLHLSTCIPILEELAPYYKRGLTVDNHAIWFIGHDRVPTYKTLLGDTTLGRRVHIRLSIEELKVIDPLFVAMGVSKSHVCALLLNLGVKHVEWLKEIEKVGV